MAILRGKWQFQPPTTPEIDWAHPVSNMLIVATSPVGDGLNYKVIVGPSALTIGTATTTSLTTKGRARRGGTNKYVKRTMPVNYTAPFSMLMVVIPRTVAATKGLFQIENSGSATSGTPQLLVQADSANLTFYLNGAYRITATGVIVANRPIVIGFTHDGTTAIGFVDGNIVGSYAGSFATNAGKNWWLGTGYNGQSDSDYLEHFQWGRCLSTTEMLELGANPYQIFRAPLLVVNASGGGGSTGTVAYTNANDTSAASGTTTVTGTLAKSNANDTSAASGTTTVQGTLATTNANDTCAASGSVGGGSTGTVAYTNANDTSTADGTTTVVGTLAKSNANDSVAASGSPVVSGSLARTNANDSVVASGATTVIGTVSKANANDIVVASGEIGSVATVARPISDVAVGGWLPNTGSSLYATVDEVVADDADYIYATAPTTCKLALNPVADPMTSSGQVVSYRAWATAGNGVVVSLKQGATTIATWTHTTLPASPIIHHQILSAAECDAITDYSALAIELTST